MFGFNSKPGYMNEGVRKHFAPLEILPLTEKREQAPQVTDLQNIKGHKNHDEIFGKSSSRIEKKQ